MANHRLDPHGQPIAISLLKLIYLVALAVVVFFLAAFLVLLQIIMVVAPGRTYVISRPRYRVIHRW